jgi:hypothetical protein
MYALTTAKNIYHAVLDGIKKESTAVLAPEAFNRLVNSYALTEWLVDKAGDVDKDQPVIDALRNLYVYTNPIDIREGKFELPKDYYRLTSVQFLLDGETEYRPVNRMRTDSLSKMKVNPYRRPSDNRLYYFQQGDFVLSYPLNNKVKKAVFFYLTRPKPIIFNTNTVSQNGNLLQEQNKEVVDICVRIFLERVKEERYQTVLTEEAIKNQKSM